MSLVEWNQKRISRLYNEVFKECMLKPMMVRRDHRLYPVDADYQLQRDDVFCLMSDYLYCIFAKEIKDLSEPPTVQFFGADDTVDYPITVRNALKLLGRDVDAEMHNVASMLNDVKLLLDPVTTQKGS